MSLLNGHRSILTREGWYYVAFTLFILGGAALREVNLLVVMGGLMVAPLVFGWRYSSLCLRGISIHRRLPQRVFAGTPAQVTLDVTNARRRTTSWVLRIDEVLTLRQRKVRRSRRQKGRATCMVGMVNPRSTTSTTYRVQFNQRGEYQFGDARVSTQFPLGIIRSLKTVRVTDSLLVLPKIGRLLPTWNTLLDSDKIGFQQSANRHGHDGDYYGLRDWQSGDNRRWIHWRTTARVGRLSVRQFERQNKPDLALIVDPWVGPNSDPAVLERAISFAATIVVNLSREGVNQLAFGVADQKAMFESHSNHRTFSDKLLERLASTEQESGDEALRQVLEETQRSVRLGTKLVVISTRPNVLHDSGLETENANSWDSVATLIRAAWIDCSSDQWKTYFRWEGHAKPTN